MTFAQLKERLNSLKGKGAWPSIAADAGIEYNTLARLARGGFENPGVVTCERVEAALVRYERELTKRKRKSVEA